MGFALMKKDTVFDLAGDVIFVMTSGWVAINFVFILFAGQTIIGFESWWLNGFELLIALAFFALAMERLLRFNKHPLVLGISTIAILVVIGFIFMRN